MGVGVFGGWAIILHCRVNKNNRDAYGASHTWGKPARRKLTVFSVMLLIFGILVTLIGAALIAKEVTLSVVGEAGNGMDTVALAGIDQVFSEVETGACHFGAGLRHRMN